MSFQRTHI